MGGAVWYRARSELRSSWRGALALALLIGLAAGIVVGTGAGARRTASTYSRMIRGPEGFDLLLNPDDGNTDFDAIEALPEVAQAGRVSGTAVAPLAPDGTPDFAYNLLIVVSDGRAGYDLLRPVQLQGRMPRRESATEVFLPRSYARQQGLTVGDTWTLGVFKSEDDAPEAVDMTVAGIGLLATDALQSPEAVNEAQTAVLAPAFFDEHPDLPPFFTGSVVRLVPGASEAQFRADARALAGEEIFLLSRAESQTKAERALRPYVVTLLAFALVAGLAAGVTLGQAAYRHLASRAGDRQVLSSLGFTPRQELAVRGTRAALLVAGSLASGVVVAAVVSTRMPIGPARGIEPNPGVDLDLAALALGASAIVALLAVAVLAASRFAGRDPASAGEGQRPSPVAGWLARRTRQPSLAAGARMALEPGSGPRAVPVRTTLAGAAFGVGIVVAVFTFTGALDGLLSTPHLYGWSWNGALIADSEHPEGALVGDVARATSGVRRITGGEYAQVEVAGMSVAGVGLEPDGIHLPMLEGRPAGADDELVLGRTTLRRIGRSVGDDVEVTGPAGRRRMHIVGVATFPRFAAYPGADKTGLGDGLAITTGAVTELAPPVTEGDEAFDFYLLDASPHALEALARTYPTVQLDDAPAVLVTEPQRPDDLVGYNNVSGAPLALAALLGLLAAGTTTHALILSTRRRRHDLAVMRVLGFTPAQVRRSVRWQAATVALVALAVGLPLGVAAGRAGWSAFADSIGTPAPPVVPWLAVAATIPAVLGLLLAVSILPGRRAGSLEPGRVLRAE